VGLLLLGIGGASSAAVRAQVDRTTVQSGDTLTLVIESDGAQSRERPDVTPLRQDFDVLGTSASSELRIVNGKRSDRTRWLVQLLPRHAGTLSIPPITVGSERTAALRLEVTEPSPQTANEVSKHVFVEVDAAAGASTYVQQQIPYTVRLFYDDTVQSGELAAPVPADAVVEQLGGERHYTAMRGQREYRVTERHYAIAAEKSGVLQIPPATFRGSAVLAQADQGGADPGENLMARLLRDTPLADDPFFRDSLRVGMRFGDAGQPVSVHSRAITLDIQPRPAGLQGNWLPAEQITLHDSWQDEPPHLRVGEPATRIITIEAKGLAASQIPPLELAQTGDARLYPEPAVNQSRTDGNVIYGISKQSFTYIPTAQGTLSVAPIELAWWNTRSNAQSRSVLAGRQFGVAAGSAALPPPPLPAPTQANGPQASPEPAAADTDRAPARTAFLDRLRDARAWIGAGALMLAMAIAAAIVRRRRTAARGTAVPVAAGKRVEVGRRSALRALRQACIVGDRRGAADALLDMARLQWPEDPPSGLRALASRLEAGVEQVLELDRALYGTERSPWNGTALRAAMRRGLQARRRQALREDDGLKALYQ